MSKTDLIYLKIWCDSVTFCDSDTLLMDIINNHNYVENYLGKATLKTDIMKMHS